MCSIRPLKGSIRIAALTRSMLPRHCVPLPLVVLFADRAWRAQVASMIAAGEPPAGVPADFGYVTDSAQSEAQERLASLCPTPNTVAR